MGANYSEIQELLQQRADIQARINLMPYDGNPEIKEVSGIKYLYVRKRVASKLTSTYVDVYSDELYQVLLRNAKERKDLSKNIRKINKELAAHGYEDKELPARVILNLDFARANMKAMIYDQAVLEGVAFAIRDSFEVARNLGLDIKSTKICGGGSKSRLWRTMFANILGVPLEILKVEQGPGYGGAMLAMVGCDEYESIQAVTDAFVEVETVIEPNSELVTKYETKYQQWRQIYPACKELFTKIK